MWKTIMQSALVLIKKRLFSTPFLIPPVEFDARIKERQMIERVQQLTRFLAIGVLTVPCSLAMVTIPNMTIQAQTIIISDDFNRPDGPLDGSLTPVRGAAWRANSGMDIVSNAVTDFTSGAGAFVPFTAPTNIPYKIEIDVMRGSGPLNQSAFLMLTDKSEPSLLLDGSSDSKVLAFSLDLSGNIGLWENSFTKQIAFFNMSGNPTDPTRLTLGVDPVTNIVTAELNGVQVFNVPHTLNATPSLVGFGHSNLVPTAFDNFQVTGDQALQEFTWQTDGIGDWGNPTNWGPPVVPNDTTAIAIFGNAITVPTVVTVDNQFRVNRIEFQSPLAYDITGMAGGILNLDADIGNASLAVVQGSHVMNVVTNAHRDLHVDVAPGASVSFNDQLNLQGNELTKVGGGSLSINGMLNTSGSTLTVVEGTLGGNGTIDGDVIRPGGTLSPESPTDRIGKLTINGNDTQGRDAKMLIEIDGTAGPGVAGGHDQLSVTGSAFLDGRLTIVTDANFSPATGLAPGEIGDTFVILETGPTTVHGEYSTVVGAHLGCGKFWLEIYTPNQMQIGAFDALEGDADGDRDIDITDFNILASNFGQSGMTWTEGSFDKDFDVDITDFNFIAANFADTGYASTSASLIPEPTSLGALGLGGLLLAVSCRGGRRMTVLG